MHLTVRPQLLKVKHGQACLVDHPFERLGLMGERLGVERKEALALASLVVDLRVTQVVNGVRGVHAILPPDVVDGLKRR